MKLNKILITTMLGFTLGLTGCASEKAETPDTPTTEVETPVTDNTVDLGNGQKAINLSEEETLQYQAGDVIVVEGDTVEFPDQLTLENNGLAAVSEKQVTRTVDGEVSTEELALRIHEGDYEAGDLKVRTNGDTSFAFNIEKIHIVEYTIEEIKHGDEIVLEEVVSVMLPKGSVFIGGSILNEENIDYDKLGKSK